MERKNDTSPQIIAKFDILCYNVKYENYKHLLSE